ncbi:MAG: FtsB family cell division protein, partial [Eggerthellaceae bacterium]
PVPLRHPSASHAGRTSAMAHSTVRSGDPYARQNATGAQDVHRADSKANADRKDKKKSLAHRVRSAKAERQFNKTFATDEPVKPGPEQSSRPALYEMKMGKTHKRSARMQNGASSKKKRGFFTRFASLFAFLDPRSPRFSSQALIACATFVLAAVMLYQPVANYYQEVRSQQQLEAEYAVVSDYYSSLKSEVEYLNTKEGLEEYVREELGWVKSGEQVSSVEGLAPRDSTAKQGSITADLSNAVPTPVTWYSPVLDFIFGYNKP